MKTLILTLFFLLTPIPAFAAYCGLVPDWATISQDSWDAACDDLAAHGYEGEMLVGLANTYAFGKCWDALVDSTDPDHDEAMKGMGTTYPSLYVIQDKKGRVYVSAQSEETQAVLDKWKEIEKKVFKTKKWKAAEKEKYPMPVPTGTVKACGTEIEIAVDVSESTSYIREEPIAAFKPKLKIMAWYDFHQIGNVDAGWTPEDGIDVGLGFEPFHVWNFNLNVVVGIRSFGGGLGINITNNFGGYVGVQVKWGSWLVAPGAGLYFTF
jgi:hypothetical protein